jgi:hypothetical protein
MKKPEQTKISLLSSEEQHIFEAMVDLNRSASKERIVPEDWSVLDIFLPSRKPTEQTAH